MLDVVVRYRLPVWTRMSSRIVLRVRAFLAVLLLCAAVLAAAAGLLILAVHGGTCSPHEGGSGCGFTIGLAIPWVLALAFTGTSIWLMITRR